MLNNLTVRRLCYLTLAASMGLLAVVLGLSILNSRAEQDVAAKQELRYKSYLLADELRQSSDDLTRLARTYVSTGDARYEQQYNEILDIRNGRKPRPQDYHRIYWDFVAADGAKPRPDEQAVPLLDLMKQAGFSEAEFAKLKQAQANSDALVRTEVIAMNAVKGLFDDGKGNFTVKKEPDLEMGRKLMHSADYHRFKAEIMKPVDEFFVLLDQRTNGAIAQAHQTADRLQFALFSAIAATILVIGILSYFLIRRIVVPLQSLSTVLNRMHRDNDLTLRVAAQHNDEYGMAAGALNGLLGGLQQSMEAVKDQAGDLLGSANELAASSGNILAGCRTQSEAASATAAAVQELAVSISHVADSAKATSKLAETATGVSIEGEKVVQAAAAGIGSISNDVNTSSTLAQSLAKRSDDISGIVRVIKEVAEQTNLLALNVAIEAARAGEQGRGFAVVADEVRKLAERTATSTAEITELIGLVHTDTRDVASNMQQYTERVSVGVDLANRAARALTEIREGTEQTQAKVADIAEATNEQSGASNEIARHVERIARMTEENSTAATEAAHLASRLEGFAGNLRAQVERFRTA